MFSLPEKSPELYAEVIIPLALPKNYTWSVPTDMQSGAQPGIRVEVVLGRNKKYAGIIKTLTRVKPPSFVPKPVLNILDKEPIISATQLMLWQWVADYYMCSEGEVMNAAVPANLKLSSETILALDETRDEDFSDLDESEYLVAEALQIKHELRIDEIQQILDIINVYPVIKRLIEKKVCYAWENLKEKYKVKTENYVRLHSDYHNEERLSDLLNNWSRAPKQMELLLAYLHLIKTEGEVTQPSLLKKSGASIAQLKGLAEKNVLIIEKRTAARLSTLPKNIETDFALSPAQEESLNRIQENLADKSVCLLHGVASSGKTQVYIKLMEAYLREGKQILYMLPEIALTAQIIRRLQKHFGGYIAVYHSKFNANERVEIWNRVRSGDIKIVLGARSSLFLPFENLGLIICDEEHDPSYKQQEPAPRYHARDTAIFYASVFGARVLLGSATPSIESYANAEQKKYGLVKLTERYGQVEMPVIDIVDIKLHSAKEKPVITPPLKEQIEKTLREKMQVILFQNRRGYSPYLLCQVCGWIPHCENCDVTLTYHKSKNKLTCHYCGSAYPVVTTCTACGSHRFTQKNFGTEKVEETLAEIFPAARIARMDYDSIKGKHDHDALIRMFEDRRVDILVGTQMVVKGLDFENVQLVGILDGDGILNFADFRVNERAFQLMEQVSGRAGRKNGKGEVLIQVSKTNHPVLGFVKEHNYEKLFEMEMENRKQFFYPPFSRIIKITFKHRETFLAEEAANLFVSGMKKGYEKYISGPAEPLVNRIRNQYLWEVMLRLPKDSRLIKECKYVVFQQIGLLQANKRYRPVVVLPDVDPV